MAKRKVLFVDESGGAWPWRRQLRMSADTWEQSSYEFSMDCTGGHDWLVVYSAWPEVELKTTVPRSRRIFVAGEPESFHRYQARFLDQFGTVLTTQRGATRHPGSIYSQPAINWFAGVQFQEGPERFKSLLSFADFEAGNPVKTKLCSVVCSTNAVTKEHRQRIWFVDLLRQEFGDQIDFYGRGVRTMPDKDVALAEYRFHIALENSVHKDYWTEKLADPFLRGCFPIYSGCSNLDDYFPSDSYVRIDIGKPRQALDTIATVLQGDADRRYARALQEAKRKVMYEYNIFPTLEKIYSRLESGVESPAGCLAEPERLFSDHEAKNFKLSRRLRRWVRQMF